MAVRPIEDRDMAAGSVCGRDVAARSIGEGDITAGKLVGAA